MMRYALLLLVLGGCTVDGTITIIHEKVTCTDTRDGEQFQFQTDTAHDARLGFGGADSCFKIIDTQGTTRTLCKSHEVYLKCQPDK